MSEEVQQAEQNLRLLTPVAVTQDPRTIGNTELIPAGSPRHRTDTPQISPGGSPTLIRRDINMPVQTDDIQMEEDKVSRDGHGSPSAQSKGTSTRSKSPTFRNHSVSDGHTLSPPAIIYQTASAPSSPTESKVLQDTLGNFGGSITQLNHKAVMVTPSGSLLAVNQSPLELRESTLTVNYMDGEDGEDISLMYTRHEKIPMKDFGAEIRASLDVKNFLEQAILMLDLDQINAEAIVDTMLDSLLKDEPASAKEEAKKSLFTHDSVHQLGKMIQGTCIAYGGGIDYDQSWICILCSVPSVQKRHVAIAKLKNPANLGRTSQEVYFIILVVAPTKEKGTKNALETGRTFATLFADMDLRFRLLGVRSDEEFKKLLWEHSKELAKENSMEECDIPLEKKESERTQCGRHKCWFGNGLRKDFSRRIPYYFSDYKDGISGNKSFQKTLSTTLFLYFACLLPCIALGVLNSNNTHGKIDVRKVMYSQTMGGLFFALLGGQPMVILLTTAPLALYTKVIYSICEEWQLDFMAMYACTGLWNAFFLLIYSFFDASRLMKWSSRSSEEIFSLFISIAFTVDAFKDIYKDFSYNYMSEACTGNGTGCSLLSDANESLGFNLTSDNVSLADLHPTECHRDTSILFLLLVLATVWVGVSLYNFTKTPFLNASKRELLADYALPVAVILMSFFGSYVFRDVKMTPFEVGSTSIFVPAPLRELPVGGVFGAMALGFCLSLLFFMDQNISAAIINGPDFRMKKGPAYHWDLMVVAILNGFLTYFGLPMMHGALPHTPLHARAMADMEERVDQGHVYQKIIRVRETRVTGILSHILLGFSIFALPYPLSYIPRPVLDGLFLYLAITALYHNQMFERIMLLFTEQSAYPPNHYIRTVPQRRVHIFTLIQLLQLGVMCGFGFSPLPYLKMVFPVLLMLLLPIRHMIVPHVISKKYLVSLDGH